MLPHATERPESGITGHILGDAAYVIDPCVMVPFKDNGHLTESQIKYNMCHAQGRNGRESTRFTER